MTQMDHTLSFRWHSLCSYWQGARGSKSLCQTEQGSRQLGCPSGWYHNTWYSCSPVGQHPLFLRTYDCTLHA